MTLYLTGEIQLFYPNKKLKCEIFELLYPTKLFRKWKKFNSKKFKCNIFQFLRIIKMFYPNTKLFLDWLVL